MLHFYMHNSTFSFSLIGSEAMDTILSLLETAREKNAREKMRKSQDRYYFTVTAQLCLIAEEP